jgi:hypothetical protein
MELGSQRELARKLKCKHSYINRLYKKNDYRIVKVGNQIDIKKSIDQFIDSGFGIISEKTKLSEQEKEEKKNKTSYQEKIITTERPEPSDTAPTKRPTQEINTEIPKLDIGADRNDLERIKVYEQTRKLRIENEIKKGKLIDKKETEDLFFEIARKIRDSLEMIAGNISSLLVGKNKHDIEQILTEHHKKVLQHLTEKI